MKRELPYKSARLTAGGLVCLIALLTILIFGTAYAEDEVGRSERVEGMGPVIQGEEHIENFSAFARISSPSTMLPQDRLDEIIDGNISTGMSASIMLDDVVAVDFRGVPPWVNTIVLLHSGDMEFDVRVRDLLGYEQTLTFDAETNDFGGGVFETRLICEGLRATSVLVSAAAGVGTLLEIEVYYLQSDPDHGPQPMPVTAQLITEWCEKYKGSPCGNSNSKKSKKSCRDLANQLVSRISWTWKWDWGNSLAWESDFTVASSYWSVDKADMAFFKGHGGPGRIAFTHEYNDCRAWNTECVGEWGDNNLEWVALSSCKTMPASEWNDWHRVFDGLHLICGMETSIKSAALGNKFGYEMAKKKRTIPQSWFKAVRSLYGPWIWPFKKKMIGACVMAEVYDNFRDHAWNAGYVSPDPSPDSYYWVWRYYFATMKAKVSGPSFERSTAILMADPEHENPAILAPASLLEAAQGDSLPILNVNHRTVNVDYVKGIADGFCSASTLDDSMFCAGYSVEYDDTSGTYYVIDGPHELYVNEQSGAFEFMNSYEYAAPLGYEPTLPDEGTAATMTAGLMSSLGVMPIEYDGFDAAHLRQVLMDETTGEVEDSSWNMSILTAYGRRHNGFPVVGPGAVMDAEHGDGDRLLSMNMNGWRDVSTGVLVSTVTLEEALENVANSGPDICIGGMPLCDTFLVDTAYLGYYEAEDDADISELPIVWIVDGWCVEEEWADTSEYQLLIPAEYTPPTGHITDPSGDTVISLGGTLTLSGNATGGLPPYEYAWYSSEIGLIDTGSTVTFVGVATDQAISHTITFEVTDANGAIDEAYVEVREGDHRIPTLSEWGLIIFALLIMTLATIAMTRRQKAAARA